MVCGRGDFGERNAGVSPRNQMSRARDLNIGLVITAFDGSRFVNLEQLGVKRSSIELENEFGNFWSSC